MANSKQIQPLSVIRVRNKQKVMRFTSRRQNPGGGRWNTRSINTSKKVWYISCTSELSGYYAMNESLNPLSIRGLDDWNQVCLTRQMNVSLLTWLCVVVLGGHIGSRWYVLGNGVDMDVTWWKKGLLLEPVVSFFFCPWHHEKIQAIHPRTQKKKTFDIHQSGFSCDRKLSYREYL